MVICRSIHETKLRKLVFLLSPIATTVFKLPPDNRATARRSNVKFSATRNWSASRINRKTRRRHYRDSWTLRGQGGALREAAAVGEEAAATAS